MGKEAFLTWHLKNIQYAIIDSCQSDSPPDFVFSLTVDLWPFMLWATAIPSTHVALLSPQSLTGDTMVRAPDYVLVVWIVL